MSLHVCYTNLRFVKNKELCFINVAHLKNRPAAVVLSRFSRKYIFQLLTDIRCICNIGLSREDWNVIYTGCAMANASIDKQSFLFFSRHSWSQSKRYFDFVIAMHHAIVWRTVSKLTAVLLMETLVLNVLNVLNYVLRNKVVFWYQVK